MALRHAVIGCGKVAGYGHLPAVAQAKGIELAAVCERDADRRRAASERYGVPGFADLSSMFRSVEIDSVTVCTTLPTHYEVALAVAESNKHCFLEKPMASTAAQCDEIVAAFERADRVLAINFEFRLNPVFQKIRQDIQSGRLGRLHSLRFVFNWDNHWHNPSIRPRRAAFLNEGFGCMDCGVHYLDMSRWLGGGEFVRLSAEGTWAEPEFRYPSHIHMIGRLDNGVMVSLEESFAYTLNAQSPLALQHYDVVGDRGVIHVHRRFDNNNSDNIVRRHLPDETTVTDDVSGKPWDDVYSEFARAAAAGTLEGSPLASGRDGAAVVRLTEQVIELCDRGRMDRPADAKM